MNRMFYQPGANVSYNLHQCLSYFKTVYVLIFIVQILCDIAQYKLPQGPVIHFIFSEYFSLRFQAIHYCSKLLLPSIGYTLN